MAMNRPAIWPIRFAKQIKMFNAITGGYARTSRTAPLLADTSEPNLSSADASRRFTSPQILPGTSRARARVSRICVTGHVLELRNEASFAPLLL